jgi:hypothetical protein
MKTIQNTNQNNTGNNRPCIVMPGSQHSNSIKS